MRESWFYKFRVRPVLSAVPGLIFDRIESRLKAGIPDITYSKPSGHGWIEMKVAKHIRHGMVLDTLTPNQINWLSSRNRVCGRCWLLCGYGDIMWLTDVFHKDQGEPSIHAYAFGPGKDREFWAERLDELL